MRKYLQGKLPGLPSAPIYSWAHVADVAHSCVLAMDKGREGCSYIGSGEKYGFAAATYLGDNTKGRVELGYNPRPLREGLVETLTVEMADLNMVAPGQGNRAKAPATAVTTRDKS